MIIDTHVHSGSMLSFNMPEATVLKAIEKYNIDIALVSNRQASECDHQQILLPQEVQVPQIVCAENSVKFAKENPGKIFAAIWVKPQQEYPDEQLINLIESNLDVIKAIKIHAYHSAVPFDGDRVEPYIQLANRLNLPVITHTGTNDTDSVDRVYNMALKFPKVNFVMAHMGLGSDNSRATQLIGKLPNLYGDTTWVPMENTIKFIKKVGSHKIMFGSDMPIDGLDTYHHNPFGQRSMYQDYFYELPKLISKEDYDNVMWKTAVYLFKLPVHV